MKFGLVEFDLKSPNTLALFFRHFLNIPYQFNTPF